jgi:hypothetical protein
VAAGLLARGAAPALASEDDSRTFFARGRELRAAGKCDAAIVEFRRALDLNPLGLGSLRNIAECEEKLRQYASARRDFWDLRRAVLQSSDPKYVGWDKAAEQAYRALEAKVPRLTIKLSGDKLDRVRVVVDGKPLDPRLVGVEIERDTGAHVVEAFFDGVTPVTEKVTLGEGAREVVTLMIPSQSSSASKPKADKPEPPRSSGALRVAGFAALGVGAAGIIATSISAAVRASALSDIEGACPGLEGCPADLKSSYDTGVTASTLVNVFGGIAIAGVGAGATLLILSTRDAGTAPSPGPRAQGSRSAADMGTGVSVSVSIAPAAGGAQARAIVRF